MMVRKRECMSCGHRWVATVVLSKYTLNLSGEAKVWCPECSGDNVISYPAERAISGITEEERRNMINKDRDDDMIPMTADAFRKMAASIDALRSRYLFDIEDGSVSMLADQHFLKSLAYLELAKCEMSMAALALQKYEADIQPSVAVEPNVLPKAALRRAPPSGDVGD